LAEVSEDLWLASGVGGASEILVGFVHTQLGVCISSCCGLEPLEFRTSNVTGTACALRNISDVEILRGSGLVSSNRSVTLVLHSPDRLLVGEDTTVEDCQDKCMLLPECTSFLVGYNSTTGTAVMPSMCIFFSENHPYYVYQLDRNRINETSVPSLTAEGFAEYREHFGTAISPRSRFYDVDVGIYVSDRGYHARDMVAGPYPEAALLLNECQDLCISNGDCFAIAYPGCYLLSASASQHAGIAASRDDTTGNSTMVFVKRHLDDTVTGVAGFPEVYASSDDGNARAAYLNRPGDCVVDSSGSVHFADVWNQQIRQISGHDVDCIHAYTSEGTKAQYDLEVQRYEWALGNATRACTQEAQIQTLYSYVQQSVLEQRSTTELESRFCQYGNGPSDSASVAFYSNFTSNVLVLCRACETFDILARPTVCPWPSLCDCRDATAEILKTEVYQTCRAPGSLQDPWHVWASSYLSCLWVSSDATQWLTNSAKNAALLQGLQSFR